MDQLCKGSTATAGQFEWVDSLLVQAMKHGHWLVISHANFCRYTVYMYNTSIAAGFLYIVHQYWTG